MSQVIYRLLVHFLWLVISSTSREIFLRRRPNFFWSPATHFLTDPQDRFCMITAKAMFSNDHIASMDQYSARVREQCGCLLPMCFTSASTFPARLTSLWRCGWVLCCLFSLLYVKCTVHTRIFVVSFFWREYFGRWYITSFNSAWMSIILYYYRAPSSDCELNCEHNFTL